MDVLVSGMARLTEYCREIGNSNECCPGNSPNDSLSHVVIKGRYNRTDRQKYARSAGLGVALDECLFGEYQTVAQLHSHKGTKES